MSGIVSFTPRRKYGRVLQWMKVCRSDTVPVPQKRRSSVSARGGTPPKLQSLRYKSGIKEEGLAAAAPGIEAGAGVVRPGCDGAGDGSMVRTTGTPLPLPAAGCTTDGAVALTVAVASSGP